MTTLNSKLQLALLNRKKRRNILEKGFTLVELMIVIVIVVEEMVIVVEEMVIVVDDPAMNLQDRPVFPAELLGTIPL